MQTPDGPPNHAGAPRVPDPLPAYPPPPAHPPAAGDARQPGDPAPPASPHPPGHPPPPGRPPVPAYPGGPIWQQQRAPVVLASGQLLANWGSRLGAWTVDAPIHLVAWIAMFVGISLIATADDEHHPAAVVALAIVIVVVGLLVILLYGPLTMAREGARNGQTWGKQLVGIRVVRDTGAPFGVGAAMLRDVVMKQVVFVLLSPLGAYLPWFLNYFWPLWDAQNRALHDMVVHSHVVKA